MEQLAALIAEELNLKVGQVKNVLALFDDGNTIPFIARYRKEMTGSLDEVQIQAIDKRFKYMQNLQVRKEEVLRSISEQNKLTDELKKQIEDAKILQEVEDLYRPYKQKKRTRATVAKENGLEPLALFVLSCPNVTSKEVSDMAAKYLSEQVPDLECALEGAKDIIAEIIADDAKFRQHIRQVTHRKGRIIVKDKDKDKDEKQVYQMYYEYDELISRIVPHRTLAINRGEKEGILKAKIEIDVEEIVEFLERQILKGRKKGALVPIIKEAVFDGYKRLIAPSIERELRNDLSEIAEKRAISIFAENLRNLLMQPPMKEKVVLGVDPAYRTGCKLAVIDATGRLIEIGVIYPHAPNNKYQEAKKKLSDIILRHNVEIVTIGNGTASRETEQLVAEVIKELPKGVSYLIVNEAGASVYSASEIAREEFPTLQVEERSAVSIARRLQDPLAELVKIDPKSVGVGQYQHDVAAKKLNESLSFVVETAVNQVGVNVNTASVALLQHVSGLTKASAKNIVKLRDEKGKFKNRVELKKIPRIGGKTYEQAIGFLRIVDGDEALDRTPIHPEHYDSVRKLLAACGIEDKQLGSPALVDTLASLDVKSMAEQLQIGEITLTDIISSLSQPERDLREQFSTPLLKSDVLKIEELKPGLKLQGTVRNVVDFGAFVDIGVKQDGLVHISKMSKQRVKHPMDIVSVGQVVTVWVKEVDVKTQRISLVLYPEALENV